MKGRYIDLLAGMALASAYGPLKPEKKERRNAMPLNPIKIIPKGCKEFEIGGENIIALSYDRAYKKFLRKSNKLKQ